MWYFAVKNFERFQHYKDRSPPWIKLYSAVLRDYEFSQLPLAQRYQLIVILLLAYQHNNRLPADPEWLKKELNCP